MRILIDKLSDQPWIRQVLVALGPLIITVITGMSEAYSATLLPQLTKPNSSIYIDDEMYSWVEFGNFTSSVYSKALEALRAIDFGIQEKTGRDILLEEIQLHLYTKTNRGNETILDMENPKELTEKRGKIIFLFHGWIDNKNFATWYDELTNKLLGRYHDAAVIQVNWETASFQDYGKAAYSIESIGKHIAKLISNLVLNFDIPIENFILIGHSMGAHVCGWTGKYFSQYTSNKLARIIALDPIGLLFHNRTDDRRLNRNDAYIVQVIHTDMYRIGISIPCGTIDFYPNGGFTQPGCQTFDLRRPLKLFTDAAYCNHLRAYEYFIEAVGMPGSFVAYRCENQEQLKNRNCKGEEVPLGDIETIDQGLYFLTTNAKPPYSKLNLYE